MKKTYKYLSGLFLTGVLSLLMATSVSAQHSGGHGGSGGFRGSSSGGGFFGGRSGSSAFSGAHGAGFQVLGQGVGIWRA